MLNELTAAIRATDFALNHAASLWPTHTESVRAVALDALRVGITEDKCSAWTRAAEAAARAGDFGRRDDASLVLAVLGACANPSLTFGDVTRPACWRDASFPRKLDGAIQALRRLAAARAPRKSAAEIIRELERRRHTSFPGIRRLAELYGVSPATMGRIVKSSAALTGWKARHAIPPAPRVAGGVDVADQPSDRAAALARLMDEQSRDDIDRIPPRP